MIQHIKHQQLDFSIAQLKTGKWIGKLEFYFEGKLIESFISPEFNTKTEIEKHGKEVLKEASNAIGLKNESLIQ